MIKLFIKNDSLLLEYSPHREEPTWIDTLFENNEVLRIKKTFFFNVNDLIIEDLETADLVAEYDAMGIRCFLLGTSEGKYFKISKEKLDIKHDLFLSKELKITEKTFLAQKNISVFGKIDDIIDENIFIGGDNESAIPIFDFEILLKNFPTAFELKLYADSRISMILKEYLGTITDSQAKLSNYLKKKKAIKAKPSFEEINSFELEKYKFIRESLVENLNNAGPYSEGEWQKLMQQFLLLLFPKYILVLENLHIKDFYSKKDQASDRYIDLTLVDANGNIDIIEIKKPFEDCLLSTRVYRDNYTPKNELSGSIVQAEKYLFHLNKWGINGEKAINLKVADKLPNGLKIKITNPKAIIIIGRDNNFTDIKKFDFEIIKRKYANMMDIITYDDLLRRLDNIISKFEQSNII
jgi:hypothetical protein